MFENGVSMFDPVAMLGCWQMGIKLWSDAAKRWNYLFFCGGLVEVLALPSALPAIVANNFD